MFIESSVSQILCVCFKALFLLFLLQSYYAEEKVASREIEELVIRGAGMVPPRTLAVNSHSGQKEP